ncbi:MAG: hypothetical protein Q4A06_05095 [Cardiobacteriaceae bacterium]|nr:hypothetical protein [Cardiobacteriaceae bacterium]
MTILLPVALEKYLRDAKKATGWQRKRDGIVYFSGFYNCFLPQQALLDGKKPLFLRRL